jgi:hypothetical protein
LEAVPGLSKRTIELRDFARELLAARHPMNLRQLHYTIFSAAKIDYQNTPADYKRLSRVTTGSRRRHREAELRGDVASVQDEIPHAWIVDELREGEMVSVWDNKADYIDTVRDSYRRDMWQDQPVHVEIWSEKASVLGSLRPVTRKLGVMLRPCRGSGSTGMEGQIGHFFESIEKPIHVFYLGDYDPSGEDIERDIHARVEKHSGKNFTITRLAIHREDIERFHLPPQKIKETDSRSRKFKQRHGDDEPTVELDALPVEELRRRVREAVEALINRKRWTRQVAIQEAELESIADLADQWRELLPDDETDDETDEDTDDEM